MLEICPPGNSDAKSLIKFDLIYFDEITKLIKKTFFNYVGYKIKKNVIKQFVSNALEIRFLYSNHDCLIEMIGFIINALHTIILLFSKQINLFILKFLSNSKFFLPTFFYLGA